jgi:alpha-beta hydrolase superfamily lysophospholipase
MKHSEGRFTGARDHTIYFQCWEPESTPRALLLIAHGAGEHSARYQSLAQFFTAHDYVVAALDFCGHGYSEGTPGHVDSFQDYLFDLTILQRQLVSQFAGVPVLLLGHSMGGLVTSNYLLQHQGEFAGGILSGPLIMTNKHPGRLQLALIRLLARVMPRLRLLKLDPVGVSRDPQEVRKYVEDPLVHHGKISASMLRELFAGMNLIHERAADLTLPMLILHGGEDVMTSPEGSRFLYQHIQSNDKTLKIYPGLYHEVFNEPEQADILAEVLSWCEARLPQP